MIQLNILEMTELWKWRTDKWFPGIKEEIGDGGGNCVYGCTGQYERSFGGCKCSVS